jgi:hypothetical protein
MDVQADGKTDSGLFVGVVGEPVAWTFTGVAAETGREVAILLNKIPPGAAIDPPQDGSAANSSVRIVWTPAAASQSGENMIVIARDLTRCRALEADAKTCDANQNLSKYDVQIAGVAWEIVQSNAVQNNTIIPPTPGTNCPPTASVGSTVLQTGLQVLTGGGLQSIVPGLLGSLVSGSTKPAGC